MMPIQTTIGEQVKSRVWDGIESRVFSKISKQLGENALLVVSDQSRNEVWDLIWGQGGIMVSNLVWAKMYQTMQTPRKDAN